MSIGFPLLLIPLAIYNIFVFLMPGVAFNAPVTGMTLPSQAAWNPTMGDALLALGLILLLFEVVKAARPGARYLTDHLLSLIVFGAAVAEFLLLTPFATSTFFLLTVMAGVEFLAGASLGIRNRRRRAAAVAEPAPVPAPTPTPTPVPVPAPAAPTVDRTEPSVMPAVPVTPPSEPSPEPPAKPVPSLVVERPAANDPVSTRAIADWKPSDLVADRDQPQPPAPPKP
jgi:outer membrane biosynthesis protein TonB